MFKRRTDEIFLGLTTPVPLHFMYVFLNLVPYLPSLETQSSVLCELSKFPHIQDGDPPKEHYNTFPLHPVPPVTAGAARHLEQANWSWKPLLSLCISVRSLLHHQVQGHEKIVSMPEKISSEGECVVQVRSVFGNSATWGIFSLPLNSTLSLSLPPQTQNCSCTILLKYGTFQITLDKTVKQMVWILHF